MTAKPKTDIVGLSDLKDPPPPKALRNLPKNETPTQFLTRLRNRRARPQPDGTTWWLCKGCSIPKPPLMFDKNYRSHNGINSICKVCTKLRAPRKPRRPAPTAASTASTSSNSSSP